MHRVFLWLIGVAFVAAIILAASSLFGTGTDEPKLDWTLFAVEVEQVKLGDRQISEFVSYEDAALRDAQFWVPVPEDGKFPDTYYDLWQHGDIPLTDELAEALDIAKSELPDWKELSRAERLELFSTFISPERTLDPLNVYAPLCLSFPERMAENGVSRIGSLPELLELAFYSSGIPEYLLNDRRMFSARGRWEERFAKRYLRFIANQQTGGFFEPWHDEFSPGNALIFEITDASALDIVEREILEVNPEIVLSRVGKHPHSELKPASQLESFLGDHPNGDRLRDRFAFYLFRLYGIEEVIGEGVVLAALPQAEPDVFRIEAITGLDAITVEVAVTKPDGTPWEGATVKVSTKQGAKSLKTTDAEGKVVFEGVTPEDFIGDFGWSFTSSHFEVRDADGYFTDIEVEKYHGETKSQVLVEITASEPPVSEMTVQDMYDELHKLMSGWIPSKRTSATYDSYGSASLLTTREVETRKRVPHGKYDVPADMGYGSLDVIRTGNCTLQQGVSEIDGEPLYHTLLPLDELSREEELLLASFERTNSRWSLRAPVWWVANELAIRGKSSFSSVEEMLYGLDAIRTRELYEEIRANKDRDRMLIGEFPHACISAGTGIPLESWHEEFSPGNAYIRRIENPRELAKLKRTSRGTAYYYFRLYGKTSIIAEGVWGVINAAKYAEMREEGYARLYPRLVNVIARVYGSHGEPWVHTYLNVEYSYRTSHNESTDSKGTARFANILLYELKSSEFAAWDESTGNWVKLKVKSLKEIEPNLYEVILAANNGGP